MSPERPDPAPTLDDPLTERVVASEVIHRGHYLEVRTETIERADGSRGTRDIVGHPGAVAVLALDDDDRLLLVRQWRVPAGRALLELPAGTLDVHDGVTEDPDVAARRELEEETGHRATHWRKLARFWTAPGFATELMHLYLATGMAGAAEDDRLAPDEDERLELRHVPPAEALAMVDRGEIADAKSILGILWLDRLRRVGEVPAGTPDPAGVAVPPPAARPAESERITLSFGFTPFEFALANAAFMRRQRFSIVIGVFGLVTLVANLLTFADIALAAITGVLSIGLLTGWVVVPFVWWSFRNKAAVLATQEAIVAATGLTSNWPAGGGSIAWTGIEKIELVSGWYFVRSVAGVAWPIPERAFRPSQLDEFRRLALRHGLTLDGHRVDPTGR